MILTDINGCEYWLDTKEIEAIEPFTLAGHYNANTKAGHQYGIAFKGSLLELIDKLRIESVLVNCARVVEVKDKGWWIVRAASPCYWSESGGKGHWSDEPYLYKKVALAEAICRMLA